MRLYFSRYLLSLLTLLAGGLFQQATAADWAQFRGPEGNGHAEGSKLPIRWGADINVTWKIPLAGQGWSSPVVSGNRIYLTAAVAEGEGFSLRTLCLDAASGKLAWETAVFGQSKMSPTIHGKNSHASPTPVVVGDRLFVHFGHRGTACLDLSGKVIWKQDQIEYSPVHGNGGSPIVVKGKVIFSVDGSRQSYVIALDAATGKEAWRRDRGSNAPRKFSFSTPAATEVNGRTLVISPGSDVVHAIDVATGEIVWYARYSGYSVIPRPVFGHGMVYMSTGYDSPTVLAIALDGTGDVTDSHIRWRLQRGAPHTPSLLLVGDELYMVSDRGIASCVDARTGTQHWQERVGSAYSASPIYASGRIYLLSEDGLGTVFAAGTTYEPLGENKVGERTLASYGVAGDALIIRSAKHLYRVEEK